MLRFWLRHLTLSFRRQGRQDLFLKEVTAPRLCTRDRRAAAMQGRRLFQFRCARTATCGMSTRKEVNAACASEQSPECPSSSEGIAPWWDGVDVGGSSRCWRGRAGASEEKAAGKQVLRRYALPAEIASPYTGHLPQEIC